MPDSTISDNLIHAFIDKQLDDSEKARVLEAMRTDRKLADHVQALQNNKDMLILTYSENYPGDTNIATNKIGFGFSSAIAATLMLTLSGLLGWVGHSYLNKNEVPLMQSIAIFDTVKEKNNRVLLHINNMDETRINDILSAAENILIYRRSEKKPLKLEIVANASGLSMLRDGSPYQKRIQSITSKYMNVSFLACGIAMENARLKEGIKIKLIPEATKIDSAIGKILDRIKNGWTYVEG